MSKLVLKQEIPGNLIPKIIRSFLMTDVVEGDSEDIKQIRATFKNKIESLNNKDTYINIYMYVDDLKGIKTYKDLTIIVELFNKFNNGLREP